MKPNGWKFATGMACVFAASLLAAAAQTGTSAPNPMIHASGAQLVDAQGNPVILRAVNLGGWLNWEGWIFGEGFVSETHIMEKLETLVGTAATQNFRRGIYSNFVAEEDFRKIAELGFNSVRVPVNYRALDSGLAGPDYQEPGWKLLDRVFDWCDRYHLYAVIDLHSAPGGQSRIFTADPGSPNGSLWQSEEQQRQTAALWRAVAGRYQHRASLAGFDLINEPNPRDGRSLPELYRQLVAAIRAEDRQHLIVIEGGSLAKDFSMFHEPLDANMAYSFHIYTWFGDQRSQELKRYETLARRQNVPIWVGEFGENNYKMIGTTVKMFEAQPEICGWAFWTWKKAPNSFPGLVTVKVPDDWRKVIAWIDHPFLKPKPGADEARHAMNAFIEAVKLESTELNQQMVGQLLPH